MTREQAFATAFVNEWLATHDRTIPHPMPVIAALQRLFILVRGER
jgi:hypothetical protein